MKSAICKDHLIYLSLIAVLVWTGGCFTGSAMNYTEWDFLLKVFAIPVLLINSVVIYFLILDIFKSQYISFSTSLLYLASSVHIDIFIYRIQFQALLAEMFIFLFFYFYRLEKWWKALGVLLIGVLLNTKLIFLSFILWRTKKFSLMQKAFSFSAVLIIFLYLSPLLFKQPMFLFSQYKTIPLILKNFILPLNFTLLNLASISPYFNKLDIGIFVVLLISLYFLRKSEVGKVVMSFIIVSLFGSFIPFKQIFTSEDSFYYYLPSLYPLVLMAFLFLIAFLMSKLKMRKNVSKSIVFLFAIYWMSSTFIIQKNFQSIVNEWTYSMVSLPENYKDEEIIKFKYAGILISNEMFDVAKKFIDEAKNKFPNEKWYLMLADIAARKGDMEEVERVYKDLNKSNAPIENEQFEE